MHFLNLPVIPQGWAAGGVTKWSDSQVTKIIFGSEKEGERGEINILVPDYLFDVSQTV